MTTAQVLTAEKSFEIGLPIGGSAGQVPVKQSTTDYDTAWTDIATQVELDAAINYLHTHDFETTQSLLAGLNVYSQHSLPTQTAIGGVGPTGQSGVQFQAGEIAIYRSSANVLGVNAGLNVDLNVTARNGGAAQTRMGNVGPSGESGVLFGLSGDTNLYRFSANTLKTDDALIVGSTLYAPDVDLTGILYFGASFDTNIYRSSAGVVKTDGYFHAVGEIAARDGQASQVNVGGIGPSSQAGIMFGNGGDVNLYRQSAGELKTDGYFEVGLDIDARRSVAEWVRIGATGPASQAGIVFGSAFDTNLYRASANILQTDDDFVSASYIVAAEGNAGRTAIGYVGPGFEAGIRLGSAGDTNLYRAGANILATQDDFYANAGAAAQVGFGSIAAGVGGIIFGLAGDTNIYRSAADSLKTDDSLNVGGIFNVGSNGFELNPGGWIISRRTDGGAFISMGEQSADPTAFADHARIFSRDNGSGKTQLCVRFGTGAVQVLATEP